MFLNFSEFLTTLKEDVGIMDLPLPATDKEIQDHLRRKTIKDFSLIYPRVKTIRIGDANMTEEFKDTSNRMRYTYVEYQVPEYEYYGCDILSIANFNIARGGGFDKFYTPSHYSGGAHVLLEAISDVRYAAGTSAAMQKTPTCDFFEPNILRVYYGWLNGIYEVELLLSHDESLSTIPYGAMTSFRDLAELDLKAFLYNKLKRKKSLEVGVGTVQLEIDDWSNAESDRKELFRQWMEESNLDYAHIRRF